MNTTRVKRIWTDYVTKGGKVVGIDKVELCAVGMADKATTIMPLSVFKKLRPIADPVNDQAAIMMHEIWNVVRPAYEAFKQGQEVPDNGTPLAAWPGITPEQASVLRGAGFCTVEDVAQATDSTIGRIQLPGARLIVENAQRFLKAQDKAQVASELAAKDEQIAALKADQEELKALVEQLMADKPRRGRPPKSETAETEAA